MPRRLARLFLLAAGARAAHLHRDNTELALALRPLKQTIPHLAAAHATNRSGGLFEAIETHKHRHRRHKREAANETAGERLEHYGYLEAEEELSNTSTHFTLARQRPPGPHNTANSTSRAIILKLATSGSTFFASVLNAVPGVRLKEELITDHKQDAKSKASAMLKALRKSAPPGGGLVGFTSNVKKVADVPIADVANATGAHLVVYRRTNLVKFAVGIWRAQQLRSAKGCATNNVKTSASEKKKTACTLPATGADLPLRDFVANLVSVHHHDRVLMGTAHRTGRDFFEVTYEDLQADRQATLTALLAHVDGPRYDPTAAPAQDKTIKVTPDDLKALLSAASFNAIRAWLASAAPCLVASLEDPLPSARETCAVNWEYTSAELASWHAATTGHSGHNFDFFAPLLDRVYHAYGAFGLGLGVRQ